MTKLEKLSLAGVSIASGLVIGYSIQAARLVRLTRKRIELTTKKQKLQKIEEAIRPKIEEVESILREMDQLPDIDECSDEEREQRKSLGDKADLLLDEIHSEFKNVDAILGINISKYL